MKTLIVGATGTIGRPLVAQTLEAGHSVTAFVRDPAKLALEHERLDVVRGDVLDPDAVRAAIGDQDAVFIALGGGAKGGIRAEGTRNIIAAMRQAGVQRLICVSSLGVGDSRGNLNFFWKHIMFGLLLRKAYGDHVEQERLVKDSGLKWTIVRPGAYTHGDVSGAYRHGFSVTARDLKLKISRADVAHFVLRQLCSDEYVSATPGISY